MRANPKGHAPDEQLYRQCVASSTAPPHGTARPAAATMRRSFRWRGRPLGARQERGASIAELIQAARWVFKTADRAGNAIQEEVTPRSTLEG